MPNPALLEQIKQFPKSIVEVSPGIWGAIGYALSNVYMIEGRSTVTIIDTTESTKAAENILKEFRKLSDKPVGRIIFTHSHYDHICGATVFAPEGDVPIIASGAYNPDTTGSDPKAIYPGVALRWRGEGQMAIGLDPEEILSLGCGPANRPMEGRGAGYLEPTEFVESDCDYDLDGVAARIILAPGETDDHLVVWLPETRLLFCGDNWYHSFPNLYTIRGTRYRDYAAWAASLDMLASLDAKIMAPGHTLPVRGAENVREVLTTTRDAILHVMKQTAEMMDSGESMADIATSVKLPPELADKPWLQEFYGKVSWSARGFATGTLGWYDGNPTTLGALSSRKRGELMAQLAGGEEALMQAAQAAQDPQWRLELCDHLIALGCPAEDLKIKTMNELAAGEVNSIARNTYLWEASRLKENRPKEPIMTF